MLLGLVYRSDKQAGFSQPAFCLQQVHPDTVLKLMLVLSHIVAPLNVLSVHPPTAFADEHRAFQKAPLSIPFPTVNFNFLRNCREQSADESFLQGSPF